MDKFVDNWNIIQTLGEGAYGEVKLLVHQVSGEAVAMKVIDLAKCKNARINVLKEERLHRFMIHPNIIRLLGKREDANVCYIFLEYAAGGELFDKIEPDVGMPEDEAQRYMKQLLAAVGYLHSKGVTHRDIKPENILLDDHGQVKLCDFGMATLFRLKGKERHLDKKCGTLPYVAPEVLIEPYYAQPAEIWSCGIVYVAMLTGELPWDEPTEKSSEYVQWMKDCCITKSPWRKLSTSAFSLARKILAPEPENRPKLGQILQHSWMNTLHNHRDSDLTDTANTKPHVDYEVPSVPQSQPNHQPLNCTIENLASLLQKQVSFSQPTHNEDLLVSSQMQYTQSPLTQNNFQRLVKRMTRIFVRTSYEETITNLCSALNKLHYTWSIDPSGAVTVTMVDSRKMPLVFKANIIDMNGKLLLNFRLSKGCGIEFKRRFIKIKAHLAEIILPKEAHI